MTPPPLRLLPLLAIPVLIALPTGIDKQPTCATHDSLWPRGILLGCVVGVAATLVYLWRNPGDRSLRGWLIAVVAFWGIAGGALGEVLNRVADDSPAQVIVARVVDRFSLNTDETPQYSQRKYRPIYYATIMNWRPTGGRRNIEVPKETFERLVPNQTLIASHVRRGAFDCEWIEHVELPH